jgi:hypothetical protein
MTNHTRVYHVFLVLAALILALAACSDREAVAVATPLPPTATAVPPTATATATATAVPPTATPTATATVTPIPPTATATATTVPPTATPAPTPTMEPMPGMFPEGISVTIDEDGECTVSGPTELPAGETTFVLRSPLDLWDPSKQELSGESYQLYINLLEDDTTYQGPGLRINGQAMSETRCIASILWKKENTLC